MTTPSLSLMIMLLFYAALNLYLLKRLHRMLAGTGFARSFAVCAAAFLAISFPAGKILSRLAPGHISEFLIFAGSLYLAPMIYAFILTAAADIFRALDFQLQITSHSKPYSRRERVRITAGIALLSAAISLLGAFNASRPAVKHLAFDFPASHIDAGNIRIAAISDIHLGRFVTKRHLERIVNLVNAQKPDIVLLAGDIINDLAWADDSVSRAEITDVFRKIEANMGVWAIPGNHEYYAGTQKVAEILKEGRVESIRDEWVAPQRRLLLIGRDDRVVEKIEGRPRKSVRAIMDDAAKDIGDEFASLPSIVLDHHPVKLDESMEAGVTLQISGHTHRGQIFPVNFLMAMIYEKHYGFFQKGGTRYYISSGAGTSGPPVRTAGRPEIVIIDIRMN